MPGEDFDESQFTPSFWEKLSDIVKTRTDTAMATVTDRLDAIDKKLAELDLESIQKQVKECKDEVDIIKNDTLPKMSSHMTALIAGSALQCLDLHTHHRKFALVMQGVKGDKNEPPEKTRKAVIDFAKDSLQVDAKEQDFAACHRNGPEANSTIHARFVDLSTRDKFLANAKRLANSKNKGISIGIDVPPCLRKVRKELAELRKALPTERKKRSFVKHLPSWPYFQLVEKAEDNKVTVTNHSFTKEAIALAALQSSLKDIEGPLAFVIK